MLETINKTDNAILKFWAPWCVPCKQTDPIIKEFSDKQSKYTVIPVNIDDYPDIANKYSIRSVPTVIQANFGEVVNAAGGLELIKKLLKTLN